MNLNQARDAILSSYDTTPIILSLIGAVLVVAVFLSVIYAGMEGSKLLDTVKVFIGTTLFFGCVATGAYLGITTNAWTRATRIATLMEDPSRLLTVYAVDDEITGGSVSLTPKTSVQLEGKPIQVEVVSKKEEIQLTKDELLSLLSISEE